MLIMSNKKSWQGDFRVSLLPSPPSAPLSVSAHPDPINFANQHPEDHTKCEVSISHVSARGGGEVSRGIQHSASTHVDGLCQHICPGPGAGQGVDLPSLAQTWIDKFLISLEAYCQQAYR